MAFRAPSTSNTASSNAALPNSSSRRFCNTVRPSGLCGGAQSITFTRDVLVEIRHDLGDTVFKACDRLRNAYIVLSDEGTAITVARSYRKAIH